MEQQLYSLQEVCKVLSLSTSAVRRLITQGHLPEGHKIPGQKSRRWFRLDIEAFLDRLRRGRHENSA